MLKYITLGLFGLFILLGALVNTGIVPITEPGHIEALSKVGGMIVGLLVCCVFFGMLMLPVMFFRWHRRWHQQVIENAMARRFRK